MGFINLKQGNSSLREYALKFTKLSNYALVLVAYFRAYMSKFMLEVLVFVVKEYRTTMLIKEMEISRLIT